MKEERRSPMVPLCLLDKTAQHNILYQRLLDAWMEAKRRLSQGALGEGEREPDELWRLVKTLRCDGASAEDKEAARLVALELICADQTEPDRAYG